MATYRKCIVQSLKNIADSASSRKRKAVVALISRENGKYVINIATLYCSVAPNLVTSDNFQWGMPVGGAFFSVKPEDRKENQAEAIYVYGFHDKDEKDDQIVKKFISEQLDPLALLLWYDALLYESKARDKHNESASDRAS